MLNESGSTELQIKERSKILFFVNGNFKATTQEIADFAGVNRTLVNYYFRSKDNLFHIVYREIIDEMKSTLDEIYDTAIPFREKVGLIIDHMYNLRLKYTFLEIFNIQETGKILNNQDSILKPKASKHIKPFLEDIAAEMEKGTIKKSNPVNFVLNLMSLVSYPFIMQPIFSTVYGMDKKEYSELLKERKQLILQVLFN